MPSTVPRRQRATGLQASGMAIHSGRPVPCRTGRCGSADASSPSILRRSGAR